MALLAFDSQKVKTKKQIKEEEQAFPSLMEEESKEQKETAQSQNKKKGKGKQQAEQIKVGFF